MKNSVTLNTITTKDTGNLNPFIRCICSDVKLNVAFGEISKREVYIMGCRVRKRGRMRRGGMWEITWLVTWNK